jgi:hypothetical protein
MELMELMELMDVLSYIGHAERRGYIRKIDGNKVFFA